MSTEIGNTFGALLENLLSGKVICNVTNDQFFVYLQDSQRREDVDIYLRRMGRTLRQTRDGAGFFAAYTSVDESSVRAKIRGRFSEAINEFEPLIRWLRLAALSGSGDGPLQAGDILWGSELQKSVESAPQLIEELARLSTTRFFSNQSSGAKKQLDSILKKLCDIGYLTPVGASGSKYIATGKWSRLYDVLQFIEAHERIDGDEDAVRQEELID